MGTKVKCRKCEHVMRMSEEDAGFDLECTKCGTLVNKARPVRTHDRPCPHCGSSRHIVCKNRTSGAGWAVFLVVLVLFFPLCWVGFLIREEIAWCERCRRNVGAY